MPASHPTLALFVPEIGNSFHVFAGGRLIGQYGGLPPHERIYSTHPGGLAGGIHTVEQVMPISASIADGKASLVIAIRVWT
jgi:hypothetical protein